MSRKIAVSAVVGFALWIAGFSGMASSTPPNRPGESDRQALKEQVAAVVEADNRFAFDLYQQLRANQKNNLFFSPLVKWRANLEKEPSLLQPFQIDEIVREVRRRLGNVSR